eukprot:GILI01003379.1.p1 GENE.GILI01003379.1~~GILI01003379.1.p1  ORF type:complete len:652 (-),score=189.57 GILI01003379.1:423-2378(-)
MDTWTSDVIPMPAALQGTTLLKSMDEYTAMYNRSVNQPDEFWDEMAKSILSWEKPYTKIKHGSFREGDIAWFLNGQLNVSYNCVDRHALTKPDEVALIWEGDSPDLVKKITYAELLREVCRVANLLKRHGVRKGDVVSIYMPMIPEAVYSMLACTRIGAPHSVVFAGFSAESLKDRIVDGQCKFVITADEGVRGGRPIHLKHTVDRAVDGLECVQKVFMFRRTGAHIDLHSRDVDASEEVLDERPYCPIEPVDSEHPLFYLYTSGSTGKPKGVAHCTAGYLLYATLTSRYVFDLQPGSVHGCMADIGWITGHSYVVYGPLCNGVTTVLFESVPTFPNAGRYWDMVERHRITSFYTAPTAIRTLIKLGDHHVTKYDRSSLRVLGSVGEPINPEAWRWYFNVVGEGKCALVDTFWQTETGGIMITPLPGVTPMKPGSATLPFFGIVPKVLDPHNGHELEGDDVAGVLAMQSLWPSVTRTVYKDHRRYLATYMQPYPNYYFTGDGTMRDKDGFYWITGRVDDVINVSGHRMGSAEIEHALVQQEGVAESAVVGFPHEIKGQGIFCYVTLKEGYEDKVTIDVLKHAVRAKIGPIATPDVILITPNLPKTRSGKIMRRILRKIASDDTSNLGDVSTLADPSVVDQLIAAANAVMKK